MDQRDGWSSPAYVTGRDLDAPEKARPYTYRFRVEPGTDSMFRRTARAKANRLNARHIAREGDSNTVFVVEKRKKGPFGWHVVRRTKVPA